MTPAADPEVWRRLETLFHRASEMEPLERAGFLDEACAGSEDLRAQLDNLLAAADKTFGFVGARIQQAARSTFDGEDSAGSRIGEYIVIRPLGSGGMGRVYLAHRADGQFDQQVAIKQMHAMLSPSEGMISRFRAERQILANLEHPNIARLLGGGVTAHGLPYLVMEYVKGTPVVEYCLSRKLSLEQRLSLFREICHAVEYAHTQLIVHRDIKPANILITDEGVSKLLDFGIAKLLVSPDGADQNTAVTETVLTPDYASPEQILGQRVTTASDVYALGGLLYEMLCGVRPFGNRAKDALEVMRLICAEMPEPPSSVARRNEAMLPAEARKLRGDLDNIIAMAMRKEPVRRYASVAQLSSDVGLYLERRPLFAAPDSWTYRAGKFVRRHKAGVAMAAAMSLIVAAFSVGMAILATRAGRQQMKADQEAQFMAGMFEAATPEEAQGRTITARDLLDRGAERVERELASEPEVRATMLSNIGSAYRSLGLSDQAQRLMQRSYDLRRRILGANAPATLESFEALAELRRDAGEFASAEVMLRQILAVRQQSLRTSHPALITTMGNLGECLYWEGKNDQAENILRAALALEQKDASPAGRNSSVRNYLALVLERRSDFSEASRLLTEAVAISRRTQGPNSPEYATSLHNLSSTLIDAGDLPEAEARLRETAAVKRRILGDQHPELALTLNNLAFVLLEEGKSESAEPVVEETYRIWRKHYGEEHIRVATAYGKLGRLRALEGNYRAASEFYGKELDIMHKVRSASWMFAGVLESMAKMELDRSNYLSAERYALQSLDLRRQNGRNDDPELASSLTDVGVARELSGRVTEAEAPLREALALRKAAFPPNHPIVMTAETRLGEALTALGKAKVAEPLLREADASAHHPPVHLLSWQVAEADYALGVCLADLGKSSEASELLERSKVGLETEPHVAIRRLAVSIAKH